MPHETRFRAGRPDDAALVAPLIYSSGPAAFDYVFSDQRVAATSFLEHAFALGGLFGHANHVVAERFGQVLAIGAFYSGRGGVLRNAATLRTITSFYGARAARVVVRGLRVEALMPPPGHDEIYVAHLGVHPSARGTGIGTTLIEEQRRRAVRDGYRRMTLDVADDNPRAEQLYRRLGFEIVWERPSTLRRGKIRVPGHRRMALVL